MENLCSVCLYPQENCWLSAKKMDYSIDRPFRCEDGFFPELLGMEKPWGLDAFPVVSFGECPPAEYCDSNKDWADNVTFVCPD